LKGEEMPKNNTLADINPDPENRRKHNPRNIGMIQEALHEVGAARSIVIDEDGKILAGSGTYEAAALAGIEKVKIVEADGNTLVAVRRTGLTKEQKRKLSIYDNRAAELSEWDTDKLLEDLSNDRKSLEGAFSDHELELLLDVDLPGEENKPKTRQKKGGDPVSVICPECGTVFVPGCDE